MFALTRRNRSLCAVAGAVLSGAALALAPLYARSAFEPAVQLSLERTSYHFGTHNPDRREVLPAIADPFARLAAEPRRPAQAQAQAQLPTLPILPANRGAWTGSPPVGIVSTIVRAIVSGKSSFALIDEGFSTRIVGRGDALDASRVRSIQDNAIILEDGRRLTLPAGAP